MSPLMAVLYLMTDWDMTVALGVNTPRDDCCWASVIVMVPMNRRSGTGMRRDTRVSR